MKLFICRVQINVVGEFIASSYARSPRVLWAVASFSIASAMRNGLAFEGSMAELKPSPSPPGPAKRSMTGKSPAELRTERDGLRVLDFIGHISDESERRKGQKLRAIFGIAAAGLDNSSAEFHCMRERKFLAGGGVGNEHSYSS